MKPDTSLAGRQLTRMDVASVGAAIAGVQRPSGEIPWCEGDKTDPWDHVEAAMGLSVAGFHEAARRAFAWLMDTQLPDGAWHAEYRDGAPAQERRDPNMSSYIAVGVLHHYLVTGDRGFLERTWRSVAAAIDFALSMQAETGAIHWSLNPDGRVDPMALLTGSASIFMSVKSALAVADILGVERPRWRKRLRKLGEAIVHKPYLFNMTKSRYSMDWFYPILSGAVSGEAARKRIERYWRKFVVKGQGVRCVSDQPWVTVAETAEFCLALDAMGNTPLADIVFQWICEKRFEDGSYWCGFTFPDMTVWPEERMTWTNGVMLMAADALYGLTPAGGIFRHGFWENRFPDLLPLS